MVEKDVREDTTQIHTLYVSVLQPGCYSNGQGIREAGACLAMFLGVSRLNEEEV